MSFFNSNAIAIMLKPLLARWIEPLEENGTLDKIQRDIEMIAQADAIPALAELVEQMKDHNALLRGMAERMKADDGQRSSELSRASENDASAFSGPDTGSAGHVGVDGTGMPGGAEPD